MTSIWDDPTGIALSRRTFVGYDVEATGGHIGTTDERDEHTNYYAPFRPE